MKKSSHLFVPLAVLFFLMIGPGKSLAYYPPIQASGSFSAHSVTVSYWDPGRQQGGSSTFDYSESVETLVQQNGVIAWVLLDNSQYYVHTCVFDPAKNKFIESVHGAYSNLQQLQVQDGVVAWYVSYGEGSGGLVHFTTYDPPSGWQSDIAYVNCVLISISLKCADGVVAWSYLYFDYIGSITMSLDLGFTIYGGGWYGPRSWVTRYTSTPYLPINTTFEISNASVVINGSTIWGYNEYTPFWRTGAYTPPIVRYSVQPESGKVPLLVYFTDMSIAPTSGSSWAWLFDDGATSSARSPWNTYQYPNDYIPTLCLTTFNGQDCQVGNVIKVKSGALPFLPLLLFD